MGISDQLITNQESGMIISKIFFPDDSYFEAGKHGVDEITVVPIAGTSGWMYWFELKRHYPVIGEIKNRYMQLWNPLHVAGVEYEPR